MTQEQNLNTEEDGMETSLAIIDHPDGDLEFTDLGKLTQNPLFDGMTVEYMREIYDGLAEEVDEQTAWQWANALKMFGGDNGSEFDLDTMGFEADGDSDLDGLSGGGIRDPLRVATLAQDNTKKKPKHVLIGQFFDRLTEEVVAETALENEDGEVVAAAVEGAVLVFHQSRTMFSGDSKKPECWSKDGVVNRHGGLCKTCPLVKDISCTNQIIFIWCSADFSHTFKINFAKTALSDGRQVVKRLRVEALPFAKIAKLSYESAENNRGSWLKPSISVTKRNYGEWQVKALRMLAELYKAYFGTVKTNLKERHAAYKEQKALPQGAGGVPGARALPAGPGIGGPVGVGDAFMSTGAQTPAPEQHVDVEALTGGKKSEA